MIKQPSPYFNTDIHLLALNILLESFNRGQNIFTLDQFLKGNYWKIDYISEEIQDTNDFGSIESMVLHQVIDIIESFDIAKIKQVSVTGISGLIEIAIRNAVKGTGPSDDVDYYVAFVDEIYDLKKLSDAKIQKEINEGGDIRGILNRVNFEKVEEAMRYLNLIPSIAASHIEFELSFIEQEAKAVGRLIAGYILAFSRDEFFGQESLYQHKRYYFSKQLENFYDYIKKFPVIGNSINIPFSSLESQGFEVVKILLWLEKEKMITLRNWNDTDMWNVKFRVAPITLQSLTTTKAQNRKAAVTGQSFKGYTLGGKRIEFDDERAKLIVDGNECEFPPYKNEHYLCRVAFKYPKGKSISWDEIYQMMFGHAPENKIKNKRTVQDTVYGINERVRDHYNTLDDLVTWRSKGVVRNFGE